MEVAMTSICSAGDCGSFFSAKGAARTAEQGWGCGRGIGDVGVRVYRLEENEEGRDLSWLSRYFPPVIPYENPPVTSAPKSAGNSAGNGRISCSGRVVVKMPVCITLFTHTPHFLLPKLLIPLLKMAPKGRAKVHQPPTRFSLRLAAPKTRHLGTRPDHHALRQ
ncbi:hypothetical protein PIB30_047828 [Stylosanthes scabra]|uniref:Uncharacterized protein n=1 Tax=Stylosanthes scabra TaxID=79078 RepID=A0ABU6ZFL2_9FABA|nr:hypothetical protein [Stylosanthes scabra]